MPVFRNPIIFGGGVLFLSVSATLERFWTQKAASCEAAPFVAIYFTP
jgi:hypothetical protein